MTDSPLPKNVVLGLWPIAGVTTIGVTPADARATLRAAIDHGIRAFDTAYSYGYAGESDRYLGEAIRTMRDECYVIGKVGQRWDANRRRVIDASPGTLVADAETSLARIGIDRFDLLMLHSVDESVEIAESARAIQSLRNRGLCCHIGVCNVDVTLWKAFASEVGCDAIQCPLNLVQPDSLESLIPKCRSASCGVYVYWTLMKGLLAGKISRDHVFAPGDSRPGYEIFQGEPRRRTHDLLDRLAPLAASAGITMSELAIGWAISQPGVTAALVGARRPEQIAEFANAQPLDPELLDAIAVVNESR